MRARDAVAAAEDWVRAVARRYEGYAGAYLSGSALEREPDAAWPEDSDVDVALVFEGDEPEKIGKMRWNGALLEPSWIPKRALSDFSAVMSTHYLAWGLHAGRALDDPQGWLTPLALRVRDAYMCPRWLRARVASVSALAEQHIAGIAAARTPEDRLMSCGFGPSCAAFPILAAVGRNCTVRRRIPAARAALEACGRGDFARRLEQALGCAGLGRGELLRHAAELERTFDVAARTDGPSRAYPFRADIRADARAAAIGGVYDMLNGAHPTDAVFWMMATFARCQIVLRMDDAGLYARRLPALMAFSDALGVGSPEAAEARRLLALDVLGEARAIAAELLPPA